MNPRIVRDSRGVPHRYPCGHCSQCLRDYQNAWTARLNEELRQWLPVVQDGKPLPPVVFFTLKYRNDSIPCQYLCLSRLGWYITDVRPSCRVLEYWTDTRRESRSQWHSRRKEMLAEYADVRSLLASLREGVATGKELAAGAFSLRRVRNPRYQVVVKQERDYQYAPDGSPVLDEDGFCKYTVREFRDVVVNDSGCDAFAYYSDLPSGFLGWHRFPGSEIDHPIFPDDEDLPPCAPDQISQVSPVLALEFHTVDKAGVQAWLKRSRRRFERAYPGGNGRLRETWADSAGVERPLPSAAITPTYKYFITSEYGPVTHRPHLHGVLFGVTYEDFERYFLADWQERYGSVDFSVMRPTGGAITYLSKYCSKGSYEHPYCCRDFIYPSGVEYHSSHYEHSLADFCIDAPMVRPTFHLISKGLGVCYAFRQEVLDYFGVQLADYVTATGRLRYVCHDAPGSLSSGLMPSLELPEVFDCFGGVDLDTGEQLPYTSFSSSLKIDLLDDGSLKLRKFTASGILMAESIIPVSAVVDRVKEELLLNQKYTRTYATSKNSTRAARGCTLPAWHFVGQPGLGGLQVRRTSIALPRYFRQFLLSPLTSALRQCAARRLHPDAASQILASLRRLGPEDTPSPGILAQLYCDEIRNLDSSSRLRRSAGRDYGRSRIYELD